jgi:hypothetical protein
VRAGGGGGGGGGGDDKTTGREADNSDVVRSSRISGPIPPLRHVHESHAQANPYFVTLLKATRIACILFCKLFINFVVCLTTGPKPLPKRALHIVRSRACAFK